MKGIRGISQLSVRTRSQWSASEYTNGPKVIVNRCWRDRVTGEGGGRKVKGPLSVGQMSRQGRKRSTLTTHPRSRVTYLSNPNISTHIYDASTVRSSKVFSAINYSYYHTPGNRKVVLCGWSNAVISTASKHQFLTQI